MRNREITNHWYVIKENNKLTIIGKREKLSTDNWLMSIYREENDGYRFSNRGPEPIIGIKISSQDIIDNFDTIVKLLSNDKEVSFALSQIRKRASSLKKNMRSL
ncbi:hypothetical protein [Spirochaeta cellobiosiphila]|uniref:hypothetical protein n=1 Tax=Spirochaeta cellobiosiphila TaxID=504483 RepID=UPI000491AD6E|nr:hypothetical protein [Spirochaeta cellobiosiphila]